MFPAPDSSGPAQRHGTKPAAAATLLGRIPELLGFTPAGCLVVVGTTGPRGLVALTLRYDLPPEGDTQSVTDICAHAAGVLAAQQITHAVLIGYGPDTLIAPFARAWRRESETAGVTVVDILRVEDHRYWSYLCNNSTCCPAGGRPFTPAGPRDGEPVLGSRAEFAATIAARTGPAADSMRAATTNAEARVARLIARARRRGTAAAARRATGAAGVRSFTEAISTYRDGGSVTSDDGLAWLLVLLRELRVRDDAWARMDPEHRLAHLRLWTDLTRAAPAGYVAAPASLLAFVAWQCGNGALANIALDRARADQPGYSMATLLRQAVTSGIPPSAARLPMTPEDVAASYDEIDEREERPRDNDGHRAKQPDTRAGTASPETIRS